MDALPDELICCVAGFSSKHDITQLIRVSKRFDKLVTPMLWRKIELHPDGHHLARDINYPDPFVPETERAYLDSDSFPTASFFEALEKIAKEDKGRFELLVARVQSLCCDVSENWELFTSFVNLEMLDLSCRYCTSYDTFSLDKLKPQPLPRLRFVSLFGQIPRDFAAWVLGAGRTLERVELGMLDRPISGTIAYERSNYPLPEEKIQPSDGESEDSDAGSDYGSLDAETVCPRPLGGFMPDTEGAQGVGFPVLKHLYLSQPSRYDFGNCTREYSWSSRAEVACLADWKKLLLAASSTLEVLVLEQRPCAEDIEQDSAGVKEYVLNNANGIGSETLIEMVIECLKDEDAFPHLRKMYLWGITVGSKDGGSIRRDEYFKTPGWKLMWLLQERGVACEARVGRWTLFEEATGELCSFYDRPVKSTDGSGAGYRRLIATTDPHKTEVDTRKPPPETEDDDYE